MICRTTGYYFDLFKALYLFSSQVYFIKHYPAVFYSFNDSIIDSLGLFHYLLEHKMLIAVLFGGIHAPFDRFGRLFDNIFIRIIHCYTVTLYNCYFIGSKTIYFSCFVKYSRHVRGKIIFIFAYAYNKGTALSDSYDLIGSFIVHNSECIGTLQ